MCENGCDEKFREARDKGIPLSEVLSEIESRRDHPLVLVGLISSDAIEEWIADHRKEATKIYAEGSLQD